MNRSSDALHRFIIEQSHVRGEVVRLDSTLRALEGTNAYPEPVRQLLAETAAATALLAATIKFDGYLTLQVKGNGPVSLLVMEATGDGTLRGVARHEGVVPDAGIRTLMGAGHLVMTIDPGRGRERYQGIVSLDETSLVRTLQNYFTQSEQLPTRLWLAVDDTSAAGFLLQNLPANRPRGALEEDDDWNRCVHLADTLTDTELLHLPVEKLLYRLFHQETVRLLGASPVNFACRCSRERVERTLKALGHTEVKQILEEDGEVEVRCEFCNTTYALDAVDIGHMFSGEHQPGFNETRH
ncbi:MAG: Hsp33 family molecular chaperone HslO [Gammaproteobacteria bacterium]|nr:Hsp33 family molecular chaperone HslO [Gammaproteobacteria bacterium]MDH3413177.1 Hsp33 family molecular chaperone HslO [Gammaproteobacteria bacterium]